MLEGNTVQQTRGQQDLEIDDEGGEWSRSLTEPGFAGTVRKRKGPATAPHDRDVSSGKRGYTVDGAVSRCVCCATVSQSQAEAMSLPILTLERRKVVVNSWMTPLRAITEKGSNEMSLLPQRDQQYR